ncbi:MAG TPA: hypothetical protein VF058_06915 [Actinomycetota bacterium]
MIATSRRRALWAALAALVLTGTLFSIPASAGDDPRVERRGGCSASSRWKMKAKKDDGRIEVEFEVDQNVNGQRWRVVMKRNGTRFFKGVRRTQPPSGSFSVERRTPDGPGRDRFRARARNLRTGEVCRGRVAI